MSGDFLMCDACYHTVDLEEEITEKHIGTPCPVCESDMLTRRDYKAFRRVKFLFKVLAFFGLARKEPRNEYDEHLSCRIHNGRIYIGER